MSKYSKANKFLEREAFKASHKVILNHNDQTFYLKTNILISDVTLLFNVNKNRLNKHILILEKIDC